MTGQLARQDRALHVASRQGVDRQIGGRRADREAFDQLSREAADRAEIE
jgi:hypothetical protein